MRNRFRRGAGIVKRPSGFLSLAAALLVAASLGASGTAAAEGLLEVPVEQFFIVRADAGVMRVMQRIVVYNPGPGAVEGVDLPVPQGVRLLEPLEGWGTVQPTSEGLRDMRTMNPGDIHEYRIIYELTLISRPVALTRALPYPVGEMDFWVQADAAELTGLHLVEIGQERLSDALFNVYAMGPVDPHPAWQVVLRPAPHTGARTLPDLSAGGARHADPFGWWADRLAQAPWVLPLAAAAFGVLAWWRRRPEGARRSARERALETEIVRLDVAYAAGDVDDDVYTTRRRELLEELLALKRNSATGNPS